MSKFYNPVCWFEIYANDLNRARKFYESVLQVKLNEIPVPDGIDDFAMLGFPSEPEAPNSGGALVFSSMMKGGTGGTLVYFGCADCSVEEGRVEAAGGKILRPKMSLGEYGFCSIVMDTEGNTIGLYSMA